MDLEFDVLLMDTAAGSEGAKAQAFDPPTIFWTTIPETLWSCLSYSVCFDNDIYPEKSKSST